MDKVFKVIISGGGTGGHIYPAIAIAKEIQKQIPYAQILFVGALGKMEMEKVPREGFEIVGLPIVGIQRSLSLSNLLFPFKLANSLLKARKIIKDFKPNIAIGVGGFASGPLLLLANWLGIPTLIQEQNSFAGITNKFLAKKAKTICVAYTGMEKFFPAPKIVFTGNPLRSDLIDITHKREKAIETFKLQKDKKTLLIIGGSLGAKSINESIATGIERILEAGYQVIWQTGKPFLETAQVATQHLQNVFVSDFIYTMDLAYSLADVVVSRAGALSVSELCLAAKPCILVPYPFAAEDHQTANAANLTKHNAAIMVKDVNAKTYLVSETLALLNDSLKQATLAQNIIKLAKPKAAEEIVAQIKKIVSLD